MAVAAPVAVASATGGTALLAGGSTAAAIAAANLAAAAAAASSAAALTAATATVGIAGAGTTGLIAPAATTASLGAAGAAAGGGGILASTTAFLTSAKGLALQAGFSGAIQVGQGFLQAREAKTAAEFSDFNARAAVLEGRRKAVIELERVNKEQARQFAAIGASGILASGSATTSALETGRKGLANVQLIGLGAAIEGRAGTLQAEALRRRGRVAILGGFVSGTSRAARLISLGNR